MKRLILLATSALLGWGAMAQTEVNAYQPGITDEGITYFLPQTRVRVVVTATKSTTSQASSANMLTDFCALRMCHLLPMMSGKLKT